jgi:GGDEF domain-containing protein
VSSRWAELRSVVSDRRPALWVAIALGLYLITWGLWLLFAPAGGTGRILVGDAFAYPADLGAVAACFLGARRVRAVPRTARAWRLLGLGALAYLLGDITYNVYDAIGISPYPSVADGFYLAFYPLMLAGVVAFPVAARPWREALRLWMDITILACSFSAFVCVVTLAPNLRASGNALQTVFSVAYPIGDLVLVGAASIALLHGSGTSVRLPLRLLSVGFVVYIVGDLVYGSEALRGAYTSGGALDTTWFAGLGLVALAATCQRPLSQPEPVDAAREHPGRLPLIAVACGFGVMVYINRGDRVFPDLAVTVLVLGVAGLLSLRMYLAQRDLLSAHARLGHIALYDTLTDLPNRTLLSDRVDRALARHRRSGTGLAVLIAEPDEYKLVTDSHGHAAGDALLVELTERLRGLSRSGETLARIGAAEFCMVAEGNRRPRDCHTRRARPHGVRRAGHHRRSGMAGERLGRGRPRQWGRAHRQGSAPRR